MKTYVILCETMHRAYSLWNYTGHNLRDLKSNSGKCPMYHIELRDGRLLYFTSYDMWFGNHGIGRRDWKRISERNFEDALDYFLKNRTSTEVTRNNG